MCDEFNDIPDIDDISDEIQEIDDISDSMPEIEDIAESENDDIDEILDSLSLDELRDLRADLTEENNDVDYSFHWDGSPTHNVEWDENNDDPPPNIKILKR